MFRRTLAWLVLLAATAFAAGPEAPEPPGYLIVMGTVTDRAKFAEYVQALPPLYARFGGEYVVLSREPKLVEGRYDHTSLVISKWPSVAAAQAFWDSPEYRELVKLREGAGTFDVLIAPGFAPPPAAGP